MGSGLSIFNNRIENVQAKENIDYQKLLSFIDESDKSDNNIELLQEKGYQLVEETNLTRTVLYLQELKSKLLTKITQPISKEIIYKMFEDYLQEFFRDKEKLVQIGLQDFTYEHIKSFTKSEVLNAILYQNKKIFIETVFEKIKKFISEINLKRKQNFAKGKHFLNENFKRFGFEVLLTNFHDTLNDNEENDGFYEESAVDDVENPNDFSVLNNNVSVLVRWMLLFFEKSGMQLQILTSEESKINYKFQLGNLLYWIIHKNLAENWKMMYDQYITELKKYNAYCYKIFGPKGLQIILEENKGNFLQFYEALIEKKESTIKEIFESQADTSHILLKPSKNKLKNIIRKILIPGIKIIFDREKSIHQIITKQLNFFMNDVFKNSGELFNKEIVFNLMSKKLKENEKAEQFQNLLMHMLNMMVVIMSKIYTKKFNLCEKKKFSILKRFLRMQENKVDNKNLEMVHALDRDINSKPSEEIVKIYQAKFQSSKASYSTLPCLTAELNLYMIFCWFMLCSGVHLSWHYDKIKQIKKKVINDQKYFSSHRFFQHKILRYMKNFDYGFNNWSIVIQLEQIIEQVMSDNKIRKKVTTEGQNSLSNMTMLRNGIKEDIKEVLMAQHENLEKYQKYSLKHDFAKDVENGSLPLDKILKSQEILNNYFYFTKLGTEGTSQTQFKPSRSVTIQIGGFNNQLENPELLWKHYVKGSSQTEFYAFNWPAFDVERFRNNEAGSEFQKVQSDPNYNDLFIIGTAFYSKAHVQTLKLNQIGSIKTYTESLHHTAAIAGKSLAYFLSESEVFGNSCITLVGYSIGSLVAYYCLRDLYLMQKSDIIYNLVSIGGLIPYEIIEPEIIKLFIGNFYNFYSQNDTMLLYSSHLNPFFSNICGLKPISFEKILYSKKKIRIFNHDMSEFVHAHSDYPQFFKKVVEFVDEMDKCYYQYDMLKK